MSDLRRWYSRTAHTVRLPRLPGSPEVAFNPLARRWRPIVDLGRSPLAPRYLQVTESVAALIASGSVAPPLWLSRAGTAGLRRQVLSHAGLDRLDVWDPRHLPVADRTAPWQAMCDAIDRFDRLDSRTKAAVIFLLVQLSFCSFAVQLADAEPLAGSEGAELTAFQVGRALGRTGKAAAAVAVYRGLADHTGDAAMRANACYHAVGYALRRAGGRPGRAEMDQIAAATATEPGSWAEALGLSRLCRLSALHALAEQGSAGRGRALRCLERGRQLAGAAAALADSNWAHSALAEHHRLLLDTELEAATPAPSANARAAVSTYAREAGAYDPNCQEFLTRLGLAEAALGDYESAANRFSVAGAMATLDGANGWFLAGQCFALIGEPDRAADAMRRCLELDPDAIEPRDYLAAPRKVDYCHEENP